MIEGWDLLLDVLADASIKLSAAFLCGTLLGAEREMKDKPAGLRTLILITVGAALFMIVSDLIARVTEGPVSITRVDPSRIASQVVTGIGFLGAGAIIQARGSIHGLTTAATVWVAAGIGLCAGVGFPLLGFAITVVVLLVLVVLDPVRAWISRQGPEAALELILPNDMLVLQRVKNVLAHYDITEDQQRLTAASNDELILHTTYRADEATQQHLLDELASLDKVRGAGVEP